MSGDKGWFIVDAVWTVAREHSHGTYTESALMQLARERLERQGLNEGMDNVLLLGAIRVAVDQRMIIRTPQGNYTHYRTNRTRMGGMSSGEMTMELLRSRGS